MMLDFDNRVKFADTAIREGLQKLKEQRKEVYRQYIERVAYIVVDMCDARAKQESNPVYLNPYCDEVIRSALTYVVYLEELMDCPASFIARTFNESLKHVAEDVSPTKWKVFFEGGRPFMELEE